MMMMAEKESSSKNPEWAKTPTSLQLVVSRHREGFLKRGSKVEVGTKVRELPSARGRG
jgi:hypothetical protein